MAPAALCRVSGKPRSVHRSESQSRVDVSRHGATDDVQAPQAEHAEDGPAFRAQSQGKAEGEAKGQQLSIVSIAAKSEQWEVYRT